MKPELPEETAPRPRLAWWRIALLLTLGVVLAALLAFVIFIALFITHHGDPAPYRGMPIVNRTNNTLTIFTPGYGKHALSHKQKDELAVNELALGETGYEAGPCD